MLDYVVAKAIISPGGWIVKIPSPKSSISIFKKLFLPAQDVMDQSVRFAATKARSYQWEAWLPTGSTRGKDVFLAFIE